MLIYKITNNVTGKCYVGRTAQTAQQRWATHQYAARQLGSTELQKAILEYGPDAFSLDVIETLYNLPDLLRAEVHYIEEFNSMRPNGYNMAPGGESYAPMTDEIRKKIGDANRGRVTSKLTRQLMSKARKGKKKSKPMTEDHKQRISEARKGQRVKPEIKIKIGEGMRKAWESGKFSTRPTTNPKMSEYMKNNPSTRNPITGRFS